MAHYNGDFLGRAALEAIGVKCEDDHVRVHRSVVIIDPEKLVLGKHVRIDPFCILTSSGGITIGNHVHVSGHCSFVGAGGIEIGDFCAVSHGVKLFSIADDLGGKFMHNPMVPDAARSQAVAPIKIERHVAVCPGSVILPGNTIGEGSIIGALSFVSKNIPAWEIWAGSPARFIRKREKDLLQFEALLAPDARSNR